MNEAMRDFEKRRRSHLQALDQAMGISSERMRQLNRTVARGIRQGTARFKSEAMGSSLGELEYQVRDRGRLVTKTKQITDIGEAAYLLDLQREADKKA